MSGQGSPEITDGAVASFLDEGSPAGALRAVVAWLDTPAAARVDVRSIVVTPDEMGWVAVVAYSRFGEPTR